MRTATQNVMAATTRDTARAVSNEITDRMATEVQSGFMTYLCRQDGLAPYQLSALTPQGPRGALSAATPPLPVKGSGRCDRVVREAALNDVTG